MDNVPVENHYQQISTKLQDFARFAKEHEKKPDEYWQHFLWSDETKLNEFWSVGVLSVWRRRGEHHDSDCTMSTVKHGGGHMELIRNLAAVGKMAFIIGIRNASVNEILNDKMIAQETRQWS